MRNRSLISRLLALLIFFCLLFAAPLAPAASNNQIRTAYYKGSSHLYLQDVARFYGLNMRVTGKELLLYSKYSRIAMTVDSRVMTLNGCQLNLSRSIARIKSKSGAWIYLIGKSDFQILLESIMRPKTIPRHRVQTILIDPGHGGKDVGAVSNKDYEKGINLQVGLRLARKLQQKGFQVFMTRVTDTAVSLDNRVACAAACKADLFVSLHCNSAGATVTGLETYIATPAGDAPTGDLVVSKKACPANRFDKENAYLAYYTQRAIVTRTRMVDRGVRRRRYYVVRNVSVCPSMLVEMGFMSNAGELATMKTSTRQEQIADSIAGSIVRYANAVK